MNRKKVGAFISIPKCGSKTILHMYNLGPNRDNDLKCKKNHFVIYENHQRLCVLEKKYNLNDKFVFTFVRNPYSRIKSWFNYHKHIPMYKNKTLNRWIKEGCKTHWKIQNQTNWVKEKKSPLLQYNFIEGNKNIDYIGKMENFQKDNIIIISKLNEIFKNPKEILEVYYKKDLEENDIIKKLKKEKFMNNCWVWLYRGAWHEWEINEIDMAVPLSPQQVLKKRKYTRTHLRMVISQPKYIAKKEVQSFISQEELLVIHLPNLVQELLKVLLTEFVFVMKYTKKV